MRKLAALGLLAALTLVLTACPAPIPYSVGVFYYPQDPSLCPDGARLVTTRNQYGIVDLVPATWPPTPPEPVTPLPEPPEGVRFTYAEFFVAGGERSGAYTSVLECRRGGQVLTTPGPRMPPLGPGRSSWWRTPPSPAT